VADDAVHAVLRCAGVDEWCVVSVRSDHDRAALSKVMEVAELPKNRTEFVAAVTAWTESRDKADIARSLQDAGVPAGPMNRAVDVLADPQLRHRKVFANMVHPLFDAPMPAEQRSAPSRHIPDAGLRPAPMPGEHTREICHKLLGMAVEESDRLITEGVLFSWSP
jgi:crotonobetainyl-CoA:carnitine CoA-transferase CaiB-like acyl-CoA transferase